MPCTASCRSSTDVHMTGASGEGSANFTQYALLGCIPTVDDDTPTPDEARDIGCMNTTSLCRSGLPFFRHRLKGDEGDAAACANFCFMHGLDIFGVVKSSVISSECRCGASSANNAVWSHEESASKEFAPPADMSSSLCTASGIEAYRYTGLFFMEGLPPVMLKDMIEDTEYVEGIAASHELGEEIEDGYEVDGVQLLGITVWKGRHMRVFQEPSWTRQCYPASCGPAWKPWTKSADSTPPSVDSAPFQGYVKIPYVWETVEGQQPDDNRKNAFRTAVKNWQVVTCINLLEVAAPPSGPHLVVGVYDRGSCYLSGMGENTPSHINLGWCSSNGNIGNMVHEIGHLIGMNHEQKRPDGAAEYHGKGPKLIMHWENIDDAWKPQYTGEASSYTGSANEGAGDVFSGYAPYDFGSIMHYPAGSAYDTNPPEDENLMGNRVALSASDIEQANDMYQCVAGSQSPTPPPTIPI
jgi:hypothetical protein